MSTTFLRDFERDPAKTIRQRLQQAWAQMERDTQQASKDARGNALRESYAKRREPDTSGPEAA